MNNFIQIIHKINGKRRKIIFQGRVRTKTVKRAARQVIEKFYQK